MALEDSVNDLVTATTDLLNAVNVAKETLDDAVASADVDANAASASAIAAADSAADALAIYGNTSVMNAAVASATASAATATTKASEASTSATQAAASASSAAAIVTGVASNRPSVRPSLLLDFSNTKQLDPRITFSRASTGTYYDGKTVAKAEENLLTYSQEFDNAAWGKAGTSLTANTTIAPDGTSTADTLTETASTGFFQVQQGFATTIGSVYTYSVYLKKGSGATAPNFFQLSFGLNGFGSTYANFNLNTGTVGSTSGLSASIINVGNGWYRCSITGAATASVSSTNALCVFTNNNDGLGRVPSYTGLVTSDIYLWGAQLEQRSTVTAYTPTTTQPITNYIPALQTALEGVARLDHNPTTGESLGLLIEEQRTNLLTYSEQFDNAVWGKTNVTVLANATAALDGTTTADKIQETTVTNFFAVSLNPTFAFSTTYVWSVYAKAAERNQLNVNFSALGQGAIYNLTGSGSIASATTPNNASISSVGNGWYRCSLVITTPASGTNLLYHIFGPSLSGASIYAGNAGSGIYIWGAQLEAGAFPTSYIPTVASQVTRSTDSASMTGSNFSSWYRADEGTVYGEFDAIGVGSTSLYNGALSFDDGSINNAMELSMWDAASDSLRWAGYSNGTPQWSITPKSYASGFTKGAGAYKVNNFNTCFDSTLGTDDMLGSVPVINRLNIGCNRGGGTSNALNGHVKRIAFWPKRLSNTELQAITS